MNKKTLPGNLMQKQCARILFLFLAFLAAGFSLRAQNSALTMRNFIKPQALTFIENKGQLADESGKLLPDIKFYGSSGGVNVYMRANRLSFVFTKTSGQKETKAENPGQFNFPDKFKTPGKSTIETSRMDMEFLNANPGPEVVSENAVESYSNFYLAHTPEEGVTHVRSFQKLTYKNLYPKIDLILLSKESGMEYEFLVHPGGKVSDIQIRWTGSDKMVASESGGIKYTNALGELNEGKPFCFTADGGVTSTFKVNDNNVGFEVGEYDASQTLTIDPIMTWSTYFGGSDNDCAYGHVLDTAKNIIITGYTSSATGIASSSALQSSYGGGANDAYISKFTASGNLLWSTYYGGSGLDFGSGVTTDSGGNIFISGATQSASGIATSGAYQTSLSGNMDGFIAGFSPNGTLSWATYFGGDIATSAQAIKLDKNDNVFITGYTISKTGIASSGAFQTSFRGANDAFLAKFTSSGKLTWSTYYGGTGYEAGYSLATDSTGSIFMTGYTTSYSGIAPSISYQNSLGGSYDAFLVKFSSSGSRLWGTYFGGAGSEIAYGLTTDSGGSAYITGTTYSNSNIATSGAFQTMYKDSGDAFVARFSSSGAIQWATYFGGEKSDLASAIAAGKGGKIYITGNTKSHNGISTYGASQPMKNSSIGGPSNLDAFVIEFSSAGNKIWGTYYGGKGDEGGIGITSDNNEVFIAGSTSNSAGLATTGAYQTINAGKTDGFMARFNPPPIIITDAGRDTSVCAGTSISLGKKLIPGNTYSWSSKPAGFISSLATVKVNPVVTTIYYLIETDSIGSGLDSVVVRIPKPVVNAGPDQTICEKGNYTGIGTPGSPECRYKWSSLPSGFSSTLPAPKVNPINKTEYILTVTDTLSGCNFKDTVFISVNSKIPHFSTYFGTGNTENIQDLAHDRYGNTYIVGSADFNGLATTGAYQGSISGSRDVIIAKFNCNGWLDWCTYYGGPGIDLSSKISVSDSGNIYVIGSTKSLTGIATNGAYRTMLNNPSFQSEDAFIVKFSSQGQRIWATYFGGPASELPHGIALDSNENIYITGSTSSSTDIASTGAYQSSYLGNNDIFIAKFTTVGNLSWSTYYGGTKYDQDAGIFSGINGDIYISGSTLSPGLATNGVHKTSISGSYGDVFVSRFSKKGKLIWTTYYGGSEEDVSAAILSDKSGNIFIGGTTASINGVATNGGFNTSFNGGFDGFVASFSATGIINWGTYFGGSKYDKINRIAMDTAGNIFISGLTSSTNGVATIGAYQSTFGGNIDAFAAKFTSKGRRIWGTYFGGMNDDESYGIGTDFTGNLYMSGITRSLSGIATSGAFQISNSGNFDAFVTKFCTLIPRTGNDTSICLGDSIQIGKPAMTGHRYSWYSTPAGFTSNLAHPFIKPIVNTIYYLIESDTFSSGMDSINVRIGTPEADAGKDKSICLPGNLVQFDAIISPECSYFWKSLSGKFSSALPVPEFRLYSPETFRLIVTDTLSKCTASDTVKISIDSAIKTFYPTYFGASGQEYASGIYHDRFENTYITGYVNGGTGLATKGAFQTSAGGGSDLFITKFNCGGQVEWSTYYAGSGNEFPGKITVDKWGYIYITGTTLSSSGIASSGAYQTSYSGSFTKQPDAFVAKFSPYGEREWSTYFGGFGNESGNGICVDSFGNVLLTGLTESNADIANSGVYQTSYAGGYGDAYIAKFANNGKLKWATYFGGPDYDQGRDIVSDSAGNIFITGLTQSASGIASSAPHQSALTGTEDAFLAAFSASGKGLWSTYYGGNGIETGNALYTINNKIYLTGYTTSSNSISSSGTYQPSFAGGDSTGFNSDAFLTAFSSTGVMQWGTYFGGPADDISHGISMDSAKNIYVAGYTNSLSGIATKGAFQVSKAGAAGNNDAFIAKFTNTGKGIAASYYGGPLDEIANGISVAANGECYLAGTTNSTTNMATSGSYQNSFGGGKEDAFLAILDFKIHTNITENPARIFFPALNINPNPFTQSLQIKYSLPKAEKVIMELTDILGRMQITLSNESQSAGEHEINLDSKKYNLQPGIYFIRLIAGEELMSRKVVCVE